MCINDHLQVCLLHMCAWVPIKARRGHHILQNWSYGQFEIPCGCQESNLVLWKPGMGHLTHSSKLYLIKQIIVYTFELLLVTCPIEFPTQSLGLLSTQFLVFAVKTSS